MSQTSFRNSPEQLRRMHQIGNRHCPLSSPRLDHNRLFEVRVIMVNVNERKGKERKYEIRRLFGDEARVLSIKLTWWLKEISERELTQQIMYYYHSAYLHTHCNLFLHWRHRLGVGTSYHTVHQHKHQSNTRTPHFASNLRLFQDKGELGLLWAVRSAEEERGSSPFRIYRYRYIR